jgi:hypothetical protein
MTAAECVTAFVDALNRAGIPFMVVGSFSSNVYGIPRSTKDADFVLEAEADAIGLLAREIDRHFTLDPQASFETVTGTTCYRFTHRDSAFVIEVFLLSADPHDIARFSRRVSASVEGHSVRVPTAEDVVITKLRWSRHGKRQKDIDDVRGIFAIQADQLDLEYVRQWTDQHGTRAILEQLLSDV